MPSLRSPIGLGAALSAGLAASLFSIAPANAAPPNQAPSGGYPGGIEGNPAPPVGACSTGFIAGSTLFSANYACQAGDKIYSNFSLLAAAPQNTLLQNSLFKISVVDTNHTIAAFNSFTPGTYSYGYTITIFDALATGQRLASVSTTASSSSQNPPANTVPQWTKTLAVATDDENLNLTTKENGSLNPIVSDSPKLFGVAVRPTSADFVSTLTVNNVNDNAVDSFSDTVIQLKGEDTVPGPLPILGAAAAFGFSRKLRSRIKQAA